MNRQMFTSCCCRFVRRYSIGFIVFATIFFLFGTNSIKAENNDDLNKFSSALEKHLVDNMHYYDSKSADILDSMVTNGHVKKIITVDDPETPENEEEVEEYDSTIIVGYVKAHQRRDSFFLFENTDIYFYAVDKNEFVDYSQIIGNDAVSKFYQKYSDQTYNEITPWSLTLFMLMLSLVVIVPIIIMIFHNTSRGTSYQSYNNSIGV
ncbi:hypothetical protein [Heyndrickxia shackletonii]|uniref:hypothetical protein n=1 Tax=Heyndrickxia shackletonii TaxID=157838 RepID=UPI0006EBFD7B|nr:hypothetical protein [Heyndrickxia shackletonii]NEZ01212.1 hypothetical protein [Heyndrickxia shackletonii]